MACERYKLTEGKKKRERRESERSEWPDSVKCNHVVFGSLAFKLHVTTCSCFSALTKAIQESQASVPLTAEEAKK